MWQIECQYNINSSANLQPLSLEDLVWILFDMRSNHNCRGAFQYQTKPNKCFVFYITFIFFINLGVFVEIIVPIHTENFYSKGTVEIHADILNVFVNAAPFCC